MKTEGGRTLVVRARILSIKVKPNAKRSELTENADGSWLATLAAPPVDGKANAELIRLVAAHFDCPRTAVSIRSGASGRLKLVSIDAESGSKSFARRF